MGLLSEQLEFLARSAAARAGISRSHAGTLRDVEEALREDGIHEALAVLNRRGHLRFTAVARFDPPFLRTLFLYDAENPGILSSGSSQVLEDSYAAIVQKWKRPFMTDNALQDSRLFRHPARDVVRSYVGAPIRLASGRAWGVLAHHDAVPHLIAPGHPELLLESAAIVGRWLAEHGHAPADGILPS